MGFVGMIVSGLLACWASPMRWRLLSLFPVAFGVLWLVLPAGQQERYFTLLGDNYNAKYSTAGDYRYEGFKAALPMFAERPLMGSGPMSFKAQKGIMPHNLYGQLLAELGSLGAIAFGLILWGVWRNVVEARRIVRESPPPASGYPGRLAWNTVTAVGTICVLLAIMSWGFNFLFWHVWLWFGAFQVVALQCLKDEAAAEQGAGSYEL
jgi:O-antigen ligase